MFSIFAKTLQTATRTDKDTAWSAPSHWVEHDHRTRAQKERDAQERRRWMRQTGIL